MKKLNLEVLQEGLYGVSKSIGGFLKEAALVCLHVNGHSSGTIISVSGLLKESFILEWDRELDAGIIKSWKDINEATEYGATAIAALMISPLTGLVITGRVPQLEQSDYVLHSVENYQKGREEPDALLEVSGILVEQKGNTINMRIQKKRKQIEGLSKRKYKTYVIVVEFSNPQSKIILV